MSELINPVFHTALVAELFDGRNDPASPAYQFMYFDGDPEGQPAINATPIPGRMWSPIRVSTEWLAESTDVDAENSTDSLKGRLAVAHLGTVTQTLARLENAGTPADLITGNRLWGATIEDLSRQRRQVQLDAGAGDSASPIIEYWDETSLPPGKKVVLLTDVIADGENQATKVNLLQMGQTSVVGVVALVDMNKGGDRFIASEARTYPGADTCIVDSTLSVHGIYVSLIATNRIGDEAGSFGLEWANSSPRRKFTPEDRVPFSPSTEPDPWHVRNDIDIPVS